MKADIEGSPSFSHVHIDLSPGETATAGSRSMWPVSAEHEIEAVSNCGFLPAVAMKIFGVTAA